MTTGPKYRIEVDSVTAIRTITVSGEIDLASADELEKVLVETPDQPVIVDLRQVDFIDSTGLRSLLSAQDTIGNEAGRLMLVFQDGPVERILQLTRLTDRFEIYPDIEDATQALS